MKLLNTAIFCTAALACAETANAQEKWRLTHFAPKTSAFYTLLTQPFLDGVEQILGDEIKITGFGAGELAPGFKAYEVVQDGIADMAYTTPQYIINSDFANTFAGGHPGGMGADAMLYWLYEAGGQELLTEFKRDTMGLHTLIAGCATGEVWHSHKPLRTVEDLEGVRFRTSGAAANVLEALGAAPVVVPGPEVYTMFERKGVDAVEYAGFADNVNMGLDKIGEYMTFPGPHMMGGCFEVVWRTETWDALAPDVQDKLESIAELATIQGLLAWKNAEVEAVKALAENDSVEIVSPDTTLVEAITEEGRKLVDTKIAENATGNDWLQKLSESYYFAMQAYDAAVPLFRR